MTSSRRGQLLVLLLLPGLLLPQLALSLVPTLRLGRPSGHRRSIARHNHGTVVQMALADPTQFSSAIEAATAAGVILAGGARYRDRAPELEPSPEMAQLGGSAPSAEAPVTAAAEPFEADRATRPPQAQTGGEVVVPAGMRVRGAEMVVDAFNTLTIAGDVCTSTIQAGPTLDIIIETTGRLVTCAPRGASLSPTQPRTEPPYYVYVSAPLEEPPPSLPRPHPHPTPHPAPQAASGGRSRGVPLAGGDGHVRGRRLMPPPSAE